MRTRKHEVLHLGDQVDGRSNSLDVLMGPADHPGPTVRKDFGELVSPEHRRDGHGHDPSAERPQDPAQQLDVVGHHEDDPVVAAQPEATQGRGDVATERGQLGIGQGPGPAHRDPVASALLHMPVDQPCRSIELVRHLRSSRSRSRPCVPNRTGAGHRPGRTRWAG
jgi:hypothetical protein